MFQTKKSPGVFFNTFTVCSSYKRKLSVCKRIKWTKQTCPSMVELPYVIMKKHSLLLIMRLIMV